MDCARFEELLFAGLDAELEPVERERMAMHEHGCARCRQLATVVAGNAEPPPRDVADEIAAVVFEQTSGATVLARLRRDLLPLAEADPGPEFLGAVLAATSDRDRRRASPRVYLPRLDLSGLWQRLAQRPRLALEGSFVVTMMALMIFGLPSASTAESPVRAFDSWWRGRTDAARQLIENASESAQRGFDSLWNESGAGDVEPDNPD